MNNLQNTITKDNINEISDKIKVQHEIAMAELDILNRNNQMDEDTYFKKQKLLDANIANTILTGFLTESQVALNKEQLNKIKQEITNLATQDRLARKQWNLGLKEFDNKWTEVERQFKIRLAESVSGLKNDEVERLGSFVQMFLGTKAAFKNSKGKKIVNKEEWDGRGKSKGGSMTTVEW